MGVMAAQAGIFAAELLRLGAFASMVAFLVMAIVGGALMPPLQGHLIDQQVIFGWPAVNVSFVLPFICFILITIYGYRTFRQVKTGIA